MKYFIFRRWEEEVGLHSLKDNVTNIGRVDSWILPNIYTRRGTRHGKRY